MANLNIPSTRDRTLDAFKGKMVGGGARPNLFECELFFPDDAIPTDSSSDEIADKSRFLVKAAQLPASNIAPILVPFRGRNLKIAGEIVHLILGQSLLLTMLILKLEQHLKDG